MSAHAAKDPAHVAVVVGGHLGSDRSEVGLGVARALHRPCIDVANAALGRSARSPFDPERPVADAERSWFDGALRHDSNLVIVAPCSVVDTLPDSPMRDHVWVAWLDVEHERLVHDAQQATPGLDLEAFRRHVDEDAHRRAVCDAVIETRELSVDDVAVDLHDRFVEFCRVEVGADPGIDSTD